MKMCCSATTDQRQGAIARAWPIAAGLLLLVAASGMARAAVPAEAARVPFALAPLDAAGEPAHGAAEATGLSLLWHPGAGLDIRGDFRTLLPTASLLGERACAGERGALGCGTAWSPVVAGTPDAGRDAALGAEWRPLEGLRLGVGVFSREALEPRAGALLLPRVLDFIAPGWEDSLSRRIRDGEGVDLSVAYGFDAGVIGELELQVELSQVLNGNVRRFSSAPNPILGLTGQPENQASVGFNWSHGDFSGSVSSRYTDGLMLNGQVHPAAWTTVDINFAWRTPWNANLSLGAQNLLGQDHGGADIGLEGATPPELDSAFSRVPYVRYEQDL